MKISKDVIDAIGIEARCTALEAMDFVPFREKELGQIRAVLTGAASDQSFSHLWDGTLRFLNK
jgi:hypothetical protein